MLSLRSCLVGAGRTLLLMVEQVLLPMGELFSTRNADTK